jgi:hypothetical protein
MRELRLFEFTLYFVRDVLKIETVRDLLSYWKASMSTYKPLTTIVMRDPSIGKEVIEGDATEAFFRIFGNRDEFHWALIGSDLMSIRRSGLSYGRGSDGRPWDTIAFAGDIRESSERVFSTVCNILQPRHGCYIPEYNDCLGSQGDILEMALQRSYHITGWHEGIAVSKSVAPLLPRLRDEVPDPSGMPSRLG